MLAHQRRGRVIRRLDRGLAGTPMRGTGLALERAGWRHSVSPFFIAAIAATESSLGRAACHNDRHNAFGLASCNGSWPVPRFQSWGHVYAFMARFLRQRWPNANSAYDYHGYAACTPCWGRKTAAWMRRLFDVGPGVRYP